MRSLPVWIVAALSVALLSPSAIAIDSTGRFMGCATVIPDASARAELSFVLSGGDWTFASDTTALFTPALSIHESLAWTYNTHGIVLSADAHADLFPWDFGSASLRAATTLFSMARVEQTPSMTASLTVEGGVRINDIVTPFVLLNGNIRLAQGDHYLVSDTQVSLLDPDFRSTLRAFVSLGSILVSSDRREDDVTISSSLTAQQDLAPFGFSHVTVHSQARLGSFASQARAAYYGHASYQIYLDAGAHWKTGRAGIAWTYTSPDGHSSASSDTRLSIRSQTEPVTIDVSTSRFVRAGWRQSVVDTALLVDGGRASLSLTTSYRSTSQEDVPLLESDGRISYLWDPVVVSLWVSYSSGTQHSFEAGICASTSW